MNSGTGKSHGKSKIIFDNHIDIVKIITDQNRQKIDSISISENKALSPRYNKQQLSNNHG